MKTIWKYQFFNEEIKVCLQGGKITIKMPKDARIVEVTSQEGKGTMWAVVDTEAEKINHTFKIYGTGHELEDKYSHSYIGTFHLEEMGLVFHIFQIFSKDG
tara:strand:- start:715 stop:1017 length:303 start_codon:yes stop_codon:yes gene_type:complete